MLTADTITDEQLRELREHAERILADVKVATQKRSNVPGPYQRRLDAQIDDARARCAESFNARAKDAK